MATKNNITHPAPEAKDLPESENYSRLVQEAGEILTEMGMIQTPSGGWVTKPETQQPKGGSDG